MEKLLEKYQGHFKEITKLYDYQIEVLTKLKDKENTLAIIPTGGGKSLLYQLISLDLEGVTLVISPLLALMEEQVNELNNKRGIKALALNSTIPFKEQRDILRELKGDSYKLIYVSPERLQNAFFRAFIVASGIKISMIVIDEAHCISQWGSNFRPEYAQINGFIDFLNKKGHSPFLLCLTATLSKLARRDILDEFQIKEAFVYVSKSIIRTNLKHQFKRVEEEKEKIECLSEFLLKHKPKKAIAYLYSKRECENYAELFSKEYKTDYYHAGIDSEEKNEAYKAFVNNEIQILFATTAFGMGIN
ncbi:MAG: RecQ family ATP-dependent DNA helicase, partial [Bacteroidia bacterium]